MIVQDFSLKEYNTFGIASFARYFATFSSAEELQNILKNIKNIPSKTILGGGSNILFTRNYDGCILKNEIQGIHVVKEDDEFVYVRAGAGILWHHFVTYCVQKNYGGIENLSLIPGSAGASPIQNIGAYGVEIKDVFYELEALHLQEGAIQKFRAADCAFGYRDSVFKKKYKGQFAVLYITCRLRKQPVLHISYGAIKAELEKAGVTEPSVQSVSEAVINIRTSKLPDPARIGNAGSFFKNPVITREEAARLHERYPSMPHFEAGTAGIKIPAGWLIEQCGWKGYRRGDAGCYEKQALVLVNYGNATGKEIYNLSEEIKISVKEKFGIELEREVNIL